MLGMGAQAQQQWEKGGENQRRLPSMNPMLSRTTTHLIPVFMGNMWQKTRRVFFPILVLRSTSPHHPADKDPWKLGMERTCEIGVCAPAKALKEQLLAAWDSTSLGVEMV